MATKFFFYLLLIIAAVYGECRCVYKMITCNWEPIGKAEILYTVGVFSGCGVVIGYLDIEDK
jgi:hypothetical protein